MARVTRKKVTTKRDKPSARSSTSLESECERLEQLCHALEERAEAMEVAHRQTVSTVSHDLCNALSVIVMSARLLLRTVAPDAPGRKQLDAILRACDEIEQLARDLVDANHVEAGTLRVDHHPQDIAPLVEQALEMAGPAAAAKPVTLSSDVAPGLSAVAADRERLLQVLLTLITNAVRFTPRGGRITLRAEAAAPSSGRGVQFSIVDTGPGIPVDQQDRLFARFSQSRRPPCQVVGLGPYVAKGIVEAHGGTIWVDSQVGVGTTVRFTMPPADSVQPPAAIAAAV
ncbi:sensor histidine kinase [Chondromyces apiculatus]|uniref:histidine kinase n=1 Tax=Chondromyces apiculatus DSM 436 TaxID=1192034 RepID=A0A017T9X1_9BACT|nr:HAMP domain-containing sensor histidine kinase [Chondromyces apiculatus]EYF05421.1 Sensor histidine kinase [Chondromyces apiculatus DSM 436]